MRLVQINLLDVTVIVIVRNNETLIELRFSVFHLCTQIYYLCIFFLLVSAGSQVG